MWIINFLLSSIGRKIIMSLTGLFLCLFLVIHLLGNLQLLVDDGGEAFNTYAYIMTHNPLIKFISIANYFFIGLHAVVGILLFFVNRNAKGTNYAVKTKANASMASKNMALLGTLILAFLFIHMGDFWLKMKMAKWYPDADWLPVAQSEALSHEVIDLYVRVTAAFDNIWLVIAYLIGQLILSFHLWHGFASAFQTLGLRHKKYTPLISGLGKAFAILIPLGFAIIPIFHYLNILF